VTTAFLQLKHHLGQAFVSYLVLFLFSPGLRDLVVLAVDAAEIAVAEKDVTGTACAREARLFAKVSGVARDDRQSARITRRYLFLKAVVTAVLWADIAG